MLPKTIFSFLLTHQSDIKKVANKRSRKKIFKAVAALAVPVAGLYMFAPNTFNSIVSFGQQNAGLVLGASVNPEIDKNKFSNAKEAKTNVIIDNIEWNIISAINPPDGTFKNIDPQDQEYCKPADNNKFILVTYSIRNIDRDLLAIPKYGLNIYDSKKVEYNFSKKTFKCILQSNNAFSRYAPSFLKRDDSKIFEVIYEVSSDSKDFKIKVGDLSVLTSDYEYIKLNL